MELRAALRAVDILPRCRVDDDLLNWNNLLAHWGSILFLSSCLIFAHYGNKESIITALSQKREEKSISAWDKPWKYLE